MNTAQGGNRNGFLFNHRGMKGYTCNLVTAHYLYFNVHDLLDPFSVVISLYNPFCLRSCTYPLLFSHCLLFGFVVMVVGEYGSHRKTKTAVYDALWTGYMGEGDLDWVVWLGRY